MGLSLLAAIGLRALPAVAAASGGEIAITYFEPLHPLDADGRGAAQKTAGERLSFDAYGRHFEVQLEPNDRIAPFVARKTDTESLHLFRGTLTDQPGSWARLATSGQNWRGMIWDGSQLYVIETATDVRDSLLPPLVANENETIIFRLVDTLPGSAAAICETPAISTGKPWSGQDAYNGLIGELHKQTGSLAMQGSRGIATTGNVDLGRCCVSRRIRERRAGAQ